MVVSQDTTIFEIRSTSITKVLLSILYAVVVYVIGTTGFHRRKCYASRNSRGSSIHESMSSYVGTYCTYIVNWLLHLPWTFSCIHTTVVYIFQWHTTAKEGNTVRQSKFAVLFTFYRGRKNFVNWQTEIQRGTRLSSGGWGCVLII